MGFRKHMDGFENYFLKMLIFKSLDIYFETIHEHLTIIQTFKKIEC